MLHCVIGEDVFLATNQENGLKFLDATNVVHLQYLFAVYVAVTAFAVRTESLRNVLKEGKVSGGFG